VLTDRQKATIESSLKKNLHRWMIEQRIACPEVGYPLSEARFASMDEWAIAQEERQDV
jgi:hypothetical protein